MTSPRKSSLLSFKPALDVPLYPPNSFSQTNRFEPYTLEQSDDFCSLSHQGKYKKAEEMDEEVWASMSGLASVLRGRGEYDKAETVYQATQVGMEEVLGNEHTNTLVTKNKLALVWRDQGKYKKAEKMHRKVPAVQERVLGKEHPDILSSMNKPAGVLSDQGKYAKAEEMFRQALAVMERVLGKEYPSKLNEYKQPGRCTERSGQV